MTDSSESRPVPNSTAHSGTMPVQPAFNEKSDSSSVPPSLNSTPPNYFQQNNIWLSGNNDQIAEKLLNESFMASIERVVPGAADRLLTMAEQQSAHRRAMETKAIDSVIADRREERAFERNGQRFGLAIVVLMLAAVVCCVAYGGHAVATILGGTSLISTLGIFMSRQQQWSQQQPANERKNEGPVKERSNKGVPTKRSKGRNANKK